MNLSDGTSTVASMDDLTDIEKQALAFERRRWNYPGAKDTAIRETFELSPWRYQQWIRDLVQKPAALQADPILVNRLRRLLLRRAAG